MHLVGASLPLDLLEDGDQDARASDVLGDIPGGQGNFGDWCETVSDTYNGLRHGGRPHHKPFSLLSCIFLCTFVGSHFTGKHLLLTGHRKRVRWRPAERFGLRASMAHPA